MLAFFKNQDPLLIFFQKGVNMTCKCKGRIALVSWLPKIILAFSETGTSWCIRSEMSHDLTLTTHRASYIISLIVEG